MTGIEVTEIATKMHVDLESSQLESVHENFFILLHPFPSTPHTPTSTFADMNGLCT